MMKLLPVLLAAGSLFVFGPSTALAQPTVTLIEADTNADEANGDTGGFRIIRDGVDADQQLTVEFTIAGTAGFSNVLDYTLSNNIFWETPNVYAVEFAADVTVVSLELTPLQDILAEGTETAIITLQTSTFNDYSLGDNFTTTIEIADDPIVASIIVDDPDADEKGLDPGSFTIHRSATGKLDENVRIFFGIGGTAIRPDDYTNKGIAQILLQTFQVTIPANELSVQGSIVVAADMLSEGTETVVYTIVPSLSKLVSYDIGDDNTGQINIEDDIPVVSMTLKEGLAAELGPVEGGIVLNRNNDGKFNAALNVLFTVEGTAEIGSDYTLSNADFWDPPNIYRTIIPANENTSIVVIVPIPDDDGTEGTETVEFAVEASQSNEYYLGAPTQAVVSIEDQEGAEDPPETVFKDSFEDP